MDEAFVRGAGINQPLQRSDQWTDRGGTRLDELADPPPSAHTRGANRSPLSTSPEQKQVSRSSGLSMRESLHSSAA